MTQWTNRELKKLREDPNELFWNDIQITPGAFEFAGVSDPVLSPWTIDGSTYNIYAFAVNDYVNFTAQMPHDWVEGTDIRPHVHWTPRDRGVAEDGNIVGWQLEVSIASITGIFDTSHTRDLQGLCSGADDKHEIAYGTGNTKDARIDMDDKEASAELVCKLSRVADTWSSNNPAANLPCILEIDFHFRRKRPQDGLGSYFEYFHLKPEYEKQRGIDKKRTD